MPEPKMEVDMEQIKSLNIDINQRVRFFDHPFAYQVTNKEVEKFCSYCMRRPDSGKLMYCSNCRFARYCDKACQKQHWRVHKTECRRLMKVFPNLPLTDVLFLSKIIDRVLFIKQHGDKYGWQKDRKFQDLMSHEDDIRNDPDRMKLFELQYEKLLKFWKDDPLPEKEDVFQLFCRTWINSHSIHNSGGTEIGLALDLGVSLYNHSCKANGALVFDGFRAMIRPLTPKLDAADWQKTTISYIDIGKSRYVRRKELKKKWYFLCECERCMDPEEEKATAIRCINEKCNEPILITEESEVMNIACDACKTITPEDRVKAAQDFMLSTPSSFSMDSNPENIEVLKKLLEEAKALLHKENIYYSRLLTAYYYVTEGKSIGGDDEDMHKLVYENYRRCFPKADRHVGYQLINLVRTLIENDKRAEAVQYAYEAMTIFEICFGLSHPFYLQILALWTFLDTGADKTKEELFKLMVFNQYRPVDINPYLAKAESMAQQIAGLKQDQEDGPAETSAQSTEKSGHMEKFYVPPDADAEAAKIIPTKPLKPEINGSGNTSEAGSGNAQGATPEAASGTTSESTLGATPQEPIKITPESTSVKAPGAATDSATVTTAATTPEATSEAPGFGPKSECTSAATPKEPAKTIPESTSATVAPEATTDSKSAKTSGSTRGTETGTVSASGADSVAATNSAKSGGKGEDKDEGTIPSSKSSNSEAVSNVKVANPASTKETKGEHKENAPKPVAKESDCSSKQANRADKKPESKKSAKGCKNGPAKTDAKEKNVSDQNKKKTKPSNSTD